MRKIIALFLISLYTIILMISYVPYMVYYGQKFLKKNNDTIQIDGSSKTLIGDACYLNAIVKRSLDKGNTNNKNTPPPNINISQSIYLMSNNNIHKYLAAICSFQFKEYTISIKETFLDIHIPPPKA